MTPAQRNWVLMIAGEAIAAKHIYARMAACEAALESAYGESVLARQANNLFGMKAHAHPEHGVMKLPTREFLDGRWVVEDAEWCKYATLEECFADRMWTLTRLRSKYPHYQAALVATTAEDYVREVSKTWSTDPQRADKVIAIFNEVFPAQTADLSSEGDV